MAGTLDGQMAGTLVGWWVVMLVALSAELLEKKLVDQMVS